MLREQVGRACVLLAACHVLHRACEAEWGSKDNLASHLAAGHGSLVGSIATLTAAAAAKRTRALEFAGKLRRAIDGGNSGEAIAAAGALLVAVQQWSSSIKNLESELLTSGALSTLQRDRLHSFELTADAFIGVGVCSHGDVVADGQVVRMPGGSLVDLRPTDMSSSGSGLDTSIGSAGSSGSGMLSARRHHSPRRQAANDLAVTNVVKGGLAAASKLLLTGGASARGSLTQRGGD